VPSQAYYDRAWGAGKWRRGLLLNLAIGQGELLATPLQLALMTAEVANGGRALCPHLVHQVRGNPRFRPERPARPGVAADPAVWDAVREGLERVVAAGTGTAARLPGVRVAGKTGTAQNPHGQDHALFVCYAPADRPTLALAVVVENRGHGGTVAAPIAGQVLRRVLLADTTRSVLPATPAPGDTTEAAGAD
jgi:penicillin-binding protein 2